MLGCFWNKFRRSVSAWWTSQFPEPMDVEYDGIVLAPPRGIDVIVLLVRSLRREDGTVVSRSYHVAIGAGTVWRQLPAFERWSFWFEDQATRVFKKAGVLRGEFWRKISDIEFSQICGDPQSLIQSYREEIEGQT